MNIACARASRMLTIAALAFFAHACWARPLLVAPKHLELPLPPGAQPGQFPPEFGPPAIDGDTVLVGARRAINTNNVYIDGVYIFQRAANGTWNYAGPLVEGNRGNPFLDGNLAAVHIVGSLQVYERGTQGWSLTATIPLASSDHCIPRQ